MGVDALSINQRRRLTETLAHEQQQSIWLTGESIAVSNQSSTPPEGAKWWWSERITIVFAQLRSVHFALDAQSRTVVWENAPFLWSSSELSGQLASSILRKLFATEPRFSRLVEDFSALAALDNEYRFFESLRQELTNEAVAQAKPEQRALDSRPQKPLGRILSPR